jgi:hypothetical protein
METRRLNHQSQAEAKFQAQEKIALALLPTPSLQTASIRGKILLESISLVFHPHFHLLRKCSNSLPSTHPSIFTDVSVEKLSAL